MTRTALAALFASSLLATPALAENFTFAHVYEEGHSHHKWALWAAEEISRRSEGRHSMEVFGAGQLGSETEINEGLSLGTVDVIYTGNGFAARSYGPIALGSAPFVYRDFDHWQAYAASDLFADLSDGYRDATGHVPLALIYFGERHVTSNKPIMAPADMEGLRIRVPDAPLLLMFPRAVNASPTPIAFAEVYLALQQGVVAAQENPLPTIKSMNFHEVQSHINLTGHIADSQLIIMSGSRWDSLSEADQAMFREVFREAAAQGSADIRAQEGELVNWFRSEGITVNEIDRAPFAEAVSAVINGPDATWTEEQFDRLQALK